MAIQGKFIINGANYSPLTIYGVGTFIIVDRPTGSLANRVRAEAIDLYKSATSGYIVDHGEWFALYRADGMIDDSTFY